MAIINDSDLLVKYKASKINIQDKRHFTYFYKRCLTLISTAIEYLDGRNI